uniref:DUF4283 domain-containing protein n=1 Tax=Cannabis sativa TaxID=3483 RepID=A0A803P1F7_CANSA
MEIAPVTLPLIQQESSAHFEIFLDPCEELETDLKEGDEGLTGVNSNSRSLDYTEPIKIGDQFVAKLDLEEVEIEASYWKSAIVRIVLGANPPFKVFEGFIKRILRNLGVEKIVRMHNYFTLVSFRDEVTRDLVLETEVFHFDKKLVLLRPWTTNMDPNQMVRYVPVSVRLNSLGLQYWGKNTLSALVSTIGKPIIVDKSTPERTMIKFA